MDTFKPSDFATWSWTTGCSCLWSPINTTCLAPEHVIGTSDSGSMHMPHSSTMHCCMLSHEVTILRLPAVTHVQRTICTPDCTRAQRSACPINYTRDEINCLRVSNIQYIMIYMGECPFFDFFGHIQAKWFALSNSLWRRAYAGNAIYVASSSFFGGNLTISTYFIQIMI